MIAIRTRERLGLRTTSRPASVNHSPAWRFLILMQIESGAGDVAGHDIDKRKGEVFIEGNVSIS
jgi:hypothetical protein